MSDRSLTLDQVRHVAKLAALCLSDEELRSMRGQLGAILEYMASLDALDVSGVEPMFHPGSLQSPLREDEVRAWPSPGELLEAAPRTEAGGFAVPRVLDGD